MPAFDPLLYRRYFPSLMNGGSFLEVMTEYMDDVLQPRSRDSWDVLKAWFSIAVTTTTTAASNTSTSPATICSGSNTTAATTTTAATSVQKSVPETSAISTKTATMKEKSEKNDASFGQEGQREADGGASAAAASSTELATKSSLGDEAFVTKADIAAGKNDADPNAESSTVSKQPGDTNRDGSAAPLPPLTPPLVDGEMECEALPPSGGDGDNSQGWSLTECKIAQNGSCHNCGEVLRSIEIPESDERRLLKQVRAFVVGVFKNFKCASPPEQRLS